MLSSNSIVEKRRSSTTHEHYILTVHQLDSEVISAPLEPFAQSGSFPGGAHRELVNMMIPTQERISLGLLITNREMIK